MRLKHMQNKIAYALTYGQIQKVSDELLGRKLNIGELKDVALNLDINYAAAIEQAICDLKLESQEGN